MVPKITPLDATFGAIVTDVDLTTLDDVTWDATWNVIEEAFLEHALLIFPQQNLSDPEQSAFGARFGEIEDLIPGTGIKSVPLSNQKLDGSILQPDEPLYATLRGNEGWHTDSTYMPLAAKASLLSAQVVPSSGGETGFADMRAAYDALDDEKKLLIENLSAYHSLFHSQAQAGYIIEPGAGYGYHTKGAPLRPLVKIHPLTGRPSLFIGRHAYGIPGLSEARSESLLQELLDFACQPPRVYTHQWQVGDIVLWDNRCLLHRACPYDYNEARVVRTTRISGDPASELAPTFEDARAGGFDWSATNP